jgi:hypothetical protein
MHPRTGICVLARLAAVVAAASLAACAVAPPTRTETTSIRQIREEFFRSYPDGRYNQNINRGEVLKGMSLFEVLASWGIPDGRVIKSESNHERWIYVLVDDRSLDWVRYDFVFQSNQLTEWEKTPHVANGASLTLREMSPGGEMSLPTWARTAPGSGAPQR